MVEFEKVIRSAREYVDKRDFQDLIIMGDFNFSKLCLSNGYVSSILSDNGIEYEFIDTLNENLNKSCTTNLLEILDFISSSLDKDCPIDVILLDFANAFDTVPRKRLLL